MKIPRKLEVILMGIFFSFIPGLCAGLILQAIFQDWTWSCIFAGAVFGFGLDVAFGKGCR